MKDINTIIVGHPPHLESLTQLLEDKGYEVVVADDINPELPKEGNVYHIGQETWKITNIRPTIKIDYKETIPKRNTNYTPPKKKRKKTKGYKR